MPVFQPCAGTRAQIDASPLRNGQLAIATDTGEMFLDYNGTRIALSATGSGGTVAVEESSVTGFAVASTLVLASTSVSGGGPAGGVDHAPGVSLDDPEEGDTIFSVVEV